MLSFTTTIIFNAIYLEGQPSQWFISTSNFSKIDKRKLKNKEMVIKKFTIGLARIQFGSRTYDKSIMKGEMMKMHENGDETTRYEKWLGKMKGML
jgi:hypothetical protein